MEYTITIPVIEVTWQLVRIIYGIMYAISLPLLIRFSYIDNKDLCTDDFDRTMKSVFQGLCIALFWPLIILAIVIYCFGWLVTIGLRSKK